MRPKIHESCFVAPNAAIIGDVEIDEGCGTRVCVSLAVEASGPTAPQGFP